MWYNYLVKASIRHYSWFCSTTHTGRCIRQCRDVISVGHWLSAAVYRYLASATSSPSSHHSVISKRLQQWDMTSNFYFNKNTRDWAYVLGLVSVAPKPSGDAHMGSSFERAPWVIARSAFEDNTNGFMCLQLTVKYTRATLVRWDLRYKCTFPLQYKSYYTLSPQEVNNNKSRSCKIYAR